jgi:hypothetical protein
MTHILISRFRRPLAGLGAAGLAAGLSFGLAGAASASTMTPGYGHQNECNEVLTYLDQEGYYGDSQWVEVDNVCFAVITHEGGYGRHHRGDQEENVFYETQRHGQRHDHDVDNVRDAHVSHGYY